MPNAVVLLSGGLDSTTTLAIAIEQGFTPYALTFEYGQRHLHEITAARNIAARYGVGEHHIFELSLDLFGGSALTADLEVPKHRSANAIGTGIPVTYVPARNTVFLSIALAWAEVIPAYDIFIGVNALDYSGYPDCRPEFIESFERMANLATKMGVSGEKFKIHTPLINLTKAEIVKKGIELNVDYGMTSSCYDPNKNGNPCGRCDACTLRLKGFKEAGISDPLIYPD